MVSSLQSWYTTKDEWKENPPLTASKVECFLPSCYDLSQQKHYAWNEQIANGDAYHWYILQG